MRTTRRPMRHVLPLVGLGLMLAGLFGGPTLLAASAADVELFVSQNDWGAQSPYGYQNPWGRQEPWDTGMIGRAEDRGTTCPIGTRFTKARSASCSAPASGAPAGIAAANTGADRRPSDQRGEAGDVERPGRRGGTDRCGAGSLCPVEEAAAAAIARLAFGILVVILPALRAR